MDEVQYNGRCGFNSMHGTFGSQSQPNVSVTDYLQGQAILRDQNSGLVFDPAVD